MIPNSNILSQSRNLIKQFEGCRLKSYSDIAGIATIGYGTTYINGLPVKLGMTITQEQADEYLDTDITIIYSALQRIFPGLSDNQFSALIDFCYNLGINAFLGSTMRTMIQNGNMTGAAEQFTLWDHSDGKVIPGLLRRRQAEQKIFLEG